MVAFVYFAAFLMYHTFMPKKKGAKQLSDEQRAVILGKTIVGLDQAIEYTIGLVPIAESIVAKRLIKLVVVSESSWRTSLAQIDQGLLCLSRMIIGRSKPCPGILVIGVKTQIGPKRIQRVAIATLGKLFLCLAE